MMHGMFLAMTAMVHPWSAEDLRIECSAPPPRISCAAYISGVFNSVEALHGRAAGLPCIGPEADLGDRVAVVSRALAGRRDLDRINAAQLTIDALSTAFPCRR